MSSFYFAVSLRRLGTIRPSLISITAALKQSAAEHKMNYRMVLNASRNCKIRRGNKCLIRIIPKSLGKQSREILFLVLASPSFSLIPINS